MNQQPVLPRNPLVCDKAPSRAARIVLALPESPRAREIRAHFLEQGWEVHVARTAGEARRLARRLCPSATVLAADGTGGESGFLTCAKLLMEKPRLRVVIVGEKSSTHMERQAHFLGASAYIPHTASFESLEKAVLGMHPSSRN